MYGKKLNNNISGKYSFKVRQKKRQKQAGAELCQAHIKLGLAKIEIFIIFIIYKTSEVIFQLTKKLRFSSIFIIT
jgi:hypothetical protein